MRPDVTEIVLVKLGGSLITDKSGESHAHLEVIERLAEEIASVRERLPERLIVGHGSGSFGHVAASRHALGQGPVDASAAAGVSATHHQAARLHRIVLDALLRAGNAPFSWAPSSALVADAGEPAEGSIEPLVRALDLALLPLTYGDVVLDRTWGAAICSTETVFRFLVARLRERGYPIRRMLWLGNTDGVYGRDGATLPRIDADGYRNALAAVGDPAGTDVTGGMLLRLETTCALARLGIESLILNGRTPGLLAAALLGDEVPGTRFLASGS